MRFFNGYKNNKMDFGKFAEFQKNIITDGDVVSNEDEEINIDSELDDILEKIDVAEKYIKDQIRESEFKGDPYFDSELYKNLDILHNFISGFIPNYPKYYDDEGNINPQAYLDSRDILKNEFPISADEILYSDNNFSGIMNDTKINIDNGYQVDEKGNVYNPNREIIFSSENKATKIKFIDILNNKAITDYGIRIDLPKNFIEENILTNESLDNELKEKYTEKKKIIELSKENNKNEDGSFNNNFKVETESKKIIGMVQGVPIFEDEVELIHLETKDSLYLGDIYQDGEIDLIDQLKRYKVEYDSLGLCNFKDIPYGELNSLLFWGGGERGVKPLASNEISGKDIKFKSDGTVYYSGANSTVSTSRPGCPSKSFKTGHVCMYSDSNKMGLKRSIIQYIYMFCSMFGIFNANIPPLVGYKSFNVFPGLCIGGLLEKILCGWQEKISKRINDMFQCIPADFLTDASESGFENETFLYGSTAKTLEDLDKVKSCKQGDRYVVSIVPTNITGLNSPACGVFIFDPQDTMSNLYRWKYKNFRGKPFNPKSNNDVIKDYSNMYNNPIIQDLLLNTNALGTDSITRKLMELQYAFIKRESLLSVTDVSTSMDAIVESAINEVLDKLTNQISSYLIMESLHMKFTSDQNSSESKFDSYEKKPYIDEFLKHFSYITDNGILKSIPLEKCKREYTISGEVGTSSITIEYYDFSLYSRDEYLVPSRTNVSYYDTIMFSSMFIPSEQLIDIFKNNIEYLKMIKSDHSKYSKIKTLNDYIIYSENKDSYKKDIEDNLKYIKYELSYNGYESNAFEQIEKRCYYTIEKANIFGGVYNG